GLLLCLKNLALSQKIIDLRLPYLPQNVSRFYPVSALVISGLFALILIRPLVAYGYSSFGTQAYENGDVNRSIQLYNLASWWNPGKTQYHSNLAAALFRKFQENEDMDLANDSTFELNYARFLNPEDEKFTRRLGDVYSVLAFRTQIPEVRNDLYRLALRYYNQTMTLNPFQPRNYYEVGKIFLKMGDQKTAKDYFFQASKIEPNYLLARFALADLYTREGRLRDAIGEYIKILTTLKTYSKVTGLTPMEKEFLDVDEEKARNLLKKLQGII
ncbi:MAG: hypothetical protein GTN53_41140, partial [Candidatus Aminicenantes bacterium]|nr:hypothetical protein [Candidatus Aminicenantes bacterium]